MSASQTDTIQRDKNVTAAAFARHLTGKYHHAADVVPPAPAQERDGQALKRLWGQTDLPASDFADEVASFYRLSRVQLPQLLSASALVQNFSRRFLREMDAFPYRDGQGGYRLAVADPTDTSCIRAAEIVLGGPVTVEVASFEDIATALTEKIGGDEASLTALEGDTSFARADDDIDSLRDLASGAPVVRAVNDLLEKAMELRASDIHIEPFRTGLTVRMRIDGLLRPVPAPLGALAQAVISRVKILAGLNIAERRLPQDGAARLRIARTDVDIRVAIMPTQHGESAVIRLLPNDRGLFTIDKLGLSGTDDARLARPFRFSSSINSSRRRRSLLRPIRKAACISSCPCPANGRAQNDIACHALDLDRGPVHIERRSGAGCGIERARGADGDRCRPRTDPHRRRSCAAGDE
jgi:general secretion pathway protein E